MEVEILKRKKEAALFLPWYALYSTHKLKSKRSRVNYSIARRYFYKGEFKRKKKKGNNQKKPQNQTKTKFNLPLFLM